MRRDIDGTCTRVLACTKLDRMSKPASAGDQSARRPSAERGFPPRTCGLRSACAACTIKSKKKSPMTLHQEKGKGHTIDTGLVYDHTIDTS
jgi:hypothetical protein